MVRIEGTLTRDPEVKTTAGGVTIVKFSIAHNTRKKDDSGQWVEGTPSFFDVDFFPNDPQYWLKRLGKGVSVIVAGTIRQDRWEHEGKTMSKVGIKADSIFAKWLPEISAGSPAPAAPPENDKNDDPPPF